MLVSSFCYVAVVTLLYQEVHLRMELTTSHPHVLHLYVYIVMLLHDCMKCELGLTCQYAVILK